MADTHVDALPFQCQRPLSMQTSDSSCPSQWPGQGALQPVGCSGEPKLLAPSTPLLCLVTWPFPCGHLRNLDLLSQTHHGFSESLKGVFMMQTGRQLLRGGSPEAMGWRGQEPDIALSASRLPLRYSWAWCAVSTWQCTCCIPGTQHVGRQCVQKDCDSLEKNN